MYLKWLWTSPIPRAAAARAVAVNKALVRRFASWHADPSAVDVSRILRVTGSINSKSGERVRQLWPREVGIAAQLYDFDTFANEVLLYTLEQIRGFREADKRRTAEARTLLLSQQREADGARTGNQRAFSNEEWHWGVVEDIRMLAHLRFNGQVPRGDAAGAVGVDLMGFHIACALAHVVPSHQLWPEIQAGVQTILPADFVRRDFHGFCSTLLDRARRAAAGQTVEYQDRRYPPSYSYAKNTIIEQLKITPAEMLDMTRLIDADEKRRRDREAWRAEHTGQTRQEYLALAAARRPRILALRQQGYTWQAIAFKEGISEAEVRRLAKTRQA